MIELFGVHVRRRALSLVRDFFSRMEVNATIGPRDAAIHALGSDRRPRRLRGVASPSIWNGRAVRYSAVGREPPRPLYSGLPPRGDGHTLRVISQWGGAMRTIIWVILTIVLSSTSSTAQPSFLAGRYVLPITQHDLYVSAPGPLGTAVTVNFRFKPIRSCTDTLDSALEYQLPPGYNDTPINEVNATCNKTIRCSGIEFKCVGASRPYPMSFQLVPLREIKASGESFSGTYRYVSPSIAPPRAAYLRRASVGNFEIVEESADKKSRTVRLRIVK